MTKDRKKNCGCSMKGGKSPYPISSAVAAEYTPRMKIVNIDGVPRAVTYDAAGTSTSGNSAQMNYMIKTPLVSGGAKTKRKTIKKKATKKTMKKPKKTMKKTKKQVKHKIHKGPRGGKYYMSKGKKVYV